MELLGVIQGAALVASIIGLAMVTINAIMDMVTDLVFGR